MKIKMNDNQACKVSIANPNGIGSILVDGTYDKVLTDHLNSSPSDEVRTKYIKSLRTSGKVVHYDNQYSEINHKPIYRVYSI